MTTDTSLAVTVVDEQKFFMIEPVAGYDPEIGQVLALLSDARQRTMRGADGLHPDAMDWEIAANMPTIGSILYHIAAVEVNWIYGIILQQEVPFDVAEWFPRTILDDRGDISPVRNISLDGHLYRLDKAHSIMLTAFQNMSVEEFRTPREVPRMRVTPEVVLQQLIQHEAEHRGQLMGMRAAAETYFEQQRLGAASTSSIQRQLGSGSDSFQPTFQLPAPEPTVNTAPRYPASSLANKSGSMPAALKRRAEARKSPIKKVWNWLTGQ